MNLPLTMSLSRLESYFRYKDFRERIKKCSYCFVKRKKQHSENAIFARMERGIQSIERLVENQDNKKEMDLETLQNSIKLLNILASMDSSLRACAQLNLSIVYKIAKNDKISARYLLQILADSPFLAQTYLLPEIWEHLFLPHLLHIKIWYNQELEFLSMSVYEDNEKRIKALKEQYNGQMDSGTTQFTLYYKEWLKVGEEAPSIPLVDLSSKPSYVRSRRRSSGSDTSYHSIGNQSQQVLQHIFPSSGRDMIVPFEATGQYFYFPCCIFLYYILTLLKVSGSFRLHSKGTLWIWDPG